jgi:hypothetical protein
MGACPKVAPIIIVMKVKIIEGISDFLFTSFMQIK